MKRAIVNFIKGIFIGAAAILPGLSGGALAAIFGIYEPVIKFLTNIRQDFKKQILFLAPIAFGGLFGVFILSKMLSFLLVDHLTEISIFFVGTMLGVFPSLVNQANKRGFKPFYIMLALAVAVGAFVIFQGMTVSRMRLVEDVNFLMWMIAGGIIGLGVTFPGLSPSNFLLFMGLFEALNQGIGNGSVDVIFPVTLGAVLSFAVTVKLVSFLLDRFYGVVFYVIIGFVITSTVMIVPRGLNLNFTSILLLLFGLSVGGIMTWIEKKVNDA